MALPINHLPCRSTSAAEWLLEMPYCLYHFSASYGFGTNKLPGGISLP